MKWVGLIVIIAAILPLANWLKRNPSDAPKLWVVVGFLPFGITPLHLFCAPISWEFWSGYVKGIEFTVLDAIAIAIYLALPPSRNPLPFRISMVFYFVAVIVSVFQAEVPMAALFYTWHLGRMFLVYAVVVRACEHDERVVPAILTGRAIGLSMEALLAIWERYVLGVLQTPGTFGHQNFLGMVSQFVIFPFVSLLLAGKYGRLPVIVSIAGAIIAVLTTSRAAVGLDAFGCTMLFAFSALRRWTSRKATIALAGGLAILMLAPIALSSFNARFSAEPQIGSYDERSALETAASMMLSETSDGTGANNYVLVANTDGYNSRAHVAWTSGAAFVHNVYWLVAAESGYFPGLITFLIMLLCPLLAAFRCSWSNQLDLRGDLLLGFAVSLLVVYIHSLFEWIFVTFPFQYMLALTVGAVGGLCQQLGYWRRAPAYIPVSSGARATKPR